MKKKYIIALLTGIIWWAGNSFFTPQLAYAEEVCFGGIGIEITLGNERFFIVSIIKNSPAEKSRLQAGDEILNIDGESVQGKTLLVIVEKLRGEVGSPILLTVRRESNSAPFEEEIVRRKICFEPQGIRYK